MADPAGEPVYRHASGGARRALPGLLVAVFCMAPAGVAITAPLRGSITDLGGRPVVIQVTVGEVRIEGWARAGLEAEITPQGRGVDPGALDVRIEETADAVTIRAIQPDGGRDAERRATVVVRLPAAAILQRIDVFEGRLDLQGLRGSIQAQVERGPIVASRLAGIVRLETTAGGITVTDAELTPVGLLRLRAFNGDIELGLVRAPADARVLALTLNGRITSDLPLSERAGFGPRFREGVFGKGEPLISLDIVRGDITITVARSNR